MNNAQRTARPPTCGRGRRTKAGLTVASLNICGRGQISSTTESGKWNALNQLARERKLGLIALQETHLDDIAVAQIHNLYGRRLRVFYSAAEENATGSQGVAIVLNREVIDLAGTKCVELIKGRAIILTLNWHAGRTLTVLNVYAPNTREEQLGFWPALTNALRDHAPRKPELILGDFNVVEESIDRLPTKEDDPAKIDSLRDFLRPFDLIDGWRTTEPTTCDYSFPVRGSLNRSRLDRIYLTRDLFDNSFDWLIATTGVPTDHRAVLASVSTASAPFIGNGRWTMPTHILYNEKFWKIATKLGTHAAERAKGLDGQRTDTENPQTVLRDLKAELKAAAKKHLKESIPRWRAELAASNARLQRLARDQDFVNNPDHQQEAATLHSHIRDLEEKQCRQTRLTTAANYILNAEQPSKYWSAINRERKPRDIIHSLRQPGSSPPTYETRSDKMATLARDYHDCLQDADTPATPHNDRASEIKTATDALRMHLAKGSADSLATLISEAEIETAIKKSQNGKAAGIDGIPYEFWKIAHRRYQCATDEDAPQFNCIAFLAKVFNDIDVHGVAETSGFADGWMCPIYKKKDKRDIGNYRPITLLNSDYKLYTKILSMRLGDIISEVLHPDQAGFVPGRHIENQTQTCRVMVDFAEAVEQDGAIIALDQEKAYDKVTHDYLWKVLEAMGFPASFITRVKELYRHASTRVMINGELSLPFLIRRGVRQGDPLSCLLFDLAIEPLACMLRSSELRGFDLPGSLDKLITALFADDTSVFLSRSDKWSELWTILRRWCAASKAKFNDGKTEVIPIGSPGYRRAVLRTRSLEPATVDAREVIPDSVRIADEGTPVRILGAWIGNGVEDVSVWTPVLQKIRDFVKRWSQCRPSLTGKRHIAQMGPAGISQYLTVVQGMPTSVEKELTKIIRGLLWGEEVRPLVALEQLHRPIEEGGLGLVDIAARNEAIELMWLKRYLSLEEKRPPWALAMDALISINAKRTAGVFDSHQQINTFLQCWDPNISHTSALPRYIVSMLKAGKKYNASFGAVKLSTQLKSRLPAWYHLSAHSALRRLDGSPLSACLRNNHGVVYVLDLQRIVHKPYRPFTGQTAPHRDHSRCACWACKDDRRLGCPHPRKCRDTAHKLLRRLGVKWDPAAETVNDNLTLTSRRKEKNIVAAEEGGDVTFDPSVTTRSSLTEAFRLFADPETIHWPVAERSKRALQIAAESRTTYLTYVQAPLERRQAPNSRRPAYGVSFLSTGDQRNAITIPDAEASTNDKTVYLLTAAIHSAITCPIDAPLRIVTKSSFLRKALVDRLEYSEDRGWLGVPLAPYLRSLVGLLRSRCAPTYIRKATTDYDLRQLVLASQAGQTLRDHERTHIIRPIIPTHFNLTGMKLATLTQSLAYQGIRSLKVAAPRRAMTRCLDEIVKAIPGSRQPEIDRTLIWEGIRHSDIRLQVTDFLWKILQGALRCGDYWKNIPGYDDRARCHICNCTETIEHILFECTAPGQRQVWSMTAALWQRKGRHWPGVSLAAVLRTGPWVWPKNDPSSDGLSRLWRILLTESTYLIWKLRCQRVIEHQADQNWTHSRAEIAAKWAWTLNSRLLLDREMARPRPPRRRLPPGQVVSTWAGTLANEASLPEDWHLKSWVLVGIAPDVYEIGDG